MIEEIHGMFDGDVVVLGAAIDPEAVRALGVHEAAIVNKAVDKRRNEFATARALARRALTRFGLADFEILHDDNRAPIWPEGFTGSLSHCSRRAFAAVGRRDRVGTLGIDAEDQPALPRDLWPLVFLDEERAFLDRLPEIDRGRVALVMFSAKESLYKAQYPRTLAFMEFADLRVSILQMDGGPRSAGEISCVFQRAVGPFAAGAVVRGRFRDVAPDVLATTVQIRDSAS